MISNITRGGRSNRKREGGEGREGGKGKKKGEGKKRQKEGRERNIFPKIHPAQ